MHYTLAQWVLFFFCYGFAGWIWECCYHAARKHEWVNRGFVHGPVIPIYGFGAIIVLWITLPFRQMPPAVLTIGCIGATILEYLTGAAMERIFHVRYWDYSHDRFNLNGYICLKASVAWGVMSLLLNGVFQPNLDDIILAIPGNVTEILSTVLLMIFSADTAKSAQNALDVRELLIKLEESNENIAEIEERLHRLSEEMGNISAPLKNKLKEIKEQADLGIAEQKKEFETRRRDFVMLNIQRRKLRRLERIEFFKSQVDEAIDSMERLMTEKNTETENVKAAVALTELKHLKERLKQAEIDTAYRSEREYRRAVSILHRNPSASSGRHAAVFEEIFSLAGKR